MSEVRNEILDFIRGLDYSPTVREIGKHVDRAPASVYRHLNVLEREGLIARKGGDGTLRRVYPVKGTRRKSIA